MHQKALKLLKYSLANGASTAILIYSNEPSTTYATVVITLNKLTPTSGATIQIISGSNGYELDVTTTSGGKVLKFINIATSFLSSFTVKNNTGVALAASGNSVVVIPEY
jgi:RecA/RadA recombinase